MIAYKFLSPGAVGLFSSFRWPIPSGGAPGDWVVAAGPLEACRSGIHACRLDHLLQWIDDELWTIELEEPVEGEDTVLVAPRGRLLRRVEGWTFVTAQEFADACALRARDRAVRALRRESRTAQADTLWRLDSLEEVKEHAAREALQVCPDAATALAFAADAAALARGRRPEDWAPHPELGGPVVQTAGATAANLAFVVAHAAGSGAAAERGEAAYGEAFAAERAWQLSWLVERLGLTALPGGGSS